MRRLMLAAILTSAISGAQAADLSDIPILRGPVNEGLSSRSVNWEGFYVGGTAGYTASELDFKRAPASLTGFIFRSSVLERPVSGLAVLTKNGDTGSNFGGFVGKNWQWDDIVLGLELNYSRIIGVESFSSDSITRSFVNPDGSTPPTGHTYTYTVTVDSKASARVTDAATFRSRAGWSVGSFLPYAFGGLAVGRADVAASATGSARLRDDYTVSQLVDLGFGNSTTILIPQSDFFSVPGGTRSFDRKGVFIYGYTFGLGLETLLFDSFFLRAEIERIQYAKVKDIPIHLDIGRVGVGYKF